MQIYVVVLTVEPAGSHPEGRVHHVIDVHHRRQRERHRVCVDVVQDVPGSLPNFPPSCAVMGR